MDADLLKRKVEYLISNDDIRKIFGEERIITYATIDNYHNILDLLIFEKDYVILLLHGIHKTKGIGFVLLGIKIL
jgi:hypothetical protein